MYHNLSADQVSAVHKLVNFLRLLHIIGELKLIVSKDNIGTGDTYSMDFLSYDSDKRKRGLIHIVRDLSILHDESSVLE